MSDKVKPIMLITFRGILSDKTYEAIKQGFTDSDIGKSYSIVIVEQQDKAEVRIITDHLKQ